MKFEMIDLVNSFVLMGQGMLGIFVGMAVIALIVFAITKFSK